MEEDNEMETLRDKIAEAMWSDYLRYRTTSNKLNEAPPPTLPSPPSSSLGFSISFFPLLLLPLPHSVDFLYLPTGYPFLLT